MVGQEHLEEHAAHEGVHALLGQQGLEAEAVPDLSEHEPAVVEVGAHHAAEERALVLPLREEMVPGVFDLLFEDDGEVGVHVPPRRVRVRAPDGWIEGLELGGSLHGRHRAVEEVEVDVDVDHHGRQRLLFLGRGAPLDVDPWFQGLHVQHRHGEDQSAVLLWRGFQPMPDQRMLNRDVVEDALRRDGGTEDAVRPHGVDRQADIVRCARLILAAVR